ncbi:uncharacterized protein LOC124116966 [Haliotis rufescens]|uniref:uncharacterized protein LOC124116966 n=1 Tax=Haliotis rufescens TaxID=6454 RepID=UPI00201F6663|nr:uncharacterized protein LOC124116966 [Haliotis rufescens]
MTPMSNSKTRLSPQTTTMASKQIPGSDLTRVPRLTFAFVENFVQANSRSAGTSQLNKGFKYYSEGFISSLKASCDDNCCRLTARCYRSQRKNESPHDIQIMLHSEPVSVSCASCSCAIGLSQCCGHITGTLYLVAHYKLCGVRSIPQDVAKTSLPQTWHIPRGDKIRGMSVQEVEVVGYKRDSDEQHKPVKSTLYNPIRSPLPPFELLFDKLTVSHPDSSLLTTVLVNPIHLL